MFAGAPDAAGRMAEADLLEGAVGRESAALGWWALPGDEGGLLA